MLGNLESDMSKRGVKVAAKGVCAACDQPIVGKVRRSEYSILSSFSHRQVVCLRHKPSGVGHFKQKVC